MLLLEFNNHVEFNICWQRETGVGYQKVEL